MLNKLKRLDAYPKPLDEFRIRTTNGAIASIITILIAGIMFVSQYQEYSKINWDETLAIDKTLREKISIKFDIVFPRVDCKVISVDTLDATGGHTKNVEDEIYEIDLDPNGVPLGDRQRQQLKTGADTVLKESDFEANKVEIEHTSKCGSCFGAGKEGDCCNTCDDVKRAYERANWSLVLTPIITQCAKEYQKFGSHGKTNGCRVKGRVRVPKAAGSFHFAPSQELGMQHSLFSELLSFTKREFNATHYIDFLQFGDGEINSSNVKSPLSKRWRNITSDEAGLFQYFIKVVPTDIISTNNYVISTNQYSATEHYLRAGASGSLPGVFFYYDFSPLRMIFREEKEGFSHFVTNICATIGGVYVVMKMVDHIVYSRSLYRGNTLSCSR